MGKKAFYDDYYDLISEGYDGLHEEEQLEKLKEIKRFLEPEKKETLLDVGCGSGISTRFFGCKRTGIDPSKKLIKIAEKKDSSGRYIVGSAENLPFNDCEFDYVVSVTAVHNFRGIEKGLKEIERVGKKHFVITVLNKAAPEKKKFIEDKINELFEVGRKTIQKHDTIFICSKK